jgi:hypothetical protein
MPDKFTTPESFASEDIYKLHPMVEGGSPFSNFCALLRRTEAVLTMELDNPDTGFGPGRVALRAGLRQILRTILVPPTDPLKRLYMVRDPNTPSELRNRSELKAYLFQERIIRGPYQDLNLQPGTINRLPNHEVNALRLAAEEAWNPVIADMRILMESRNDDQLGHLYLLSGHFDNRGERGLNPYPYGVEFRYAEVVSPDNTSTYDLFVHRLPYRYDSTNVRWQEPIEEPMDI